MILYRITNATNGKSYIGITSRPLSRRMIEHVVDARRNKGRSALHAAMRKYGAPAFSIEAIAQASDWESLNKMEIAAIELYATREPSGYNLSLGGGGLRGWRHSIAAREKMSAANVGRTVSPEHLAKMNAARLAKVRGVPLSVEHRAKIAAAHKGRTVSAATRAMLAAANLGKTASPEARAKMAAAHRGRKQTPEHIEARSAPRRGKPHAHRGVKKTPEHIAKIAAALRGRKMSDAARAAIIAAQRARRKRERETVSYLQVS